MFKAKLVAISVLAVLGLAGAARADQGDSTPLRLIGEAPGIGASGPQRFIINADVTEGGKGEKSEVSGSLSGLPPSTLSGRISGGCQGKHCDLSIETDSQHFDLHGDLIGLTGSAAGTFDVTGDVAEGAPAKGAVTFRPIPDVVDGLGKRIKPDALDAGALDDLLLWNGMSVAFGDTPSGPFDDFQLSDLGSWQQKNDRPETGLLFSTDLDLMTRQRATAQKAVGWVVIGDPGMGWTAGYPAALLPQASRVGREQHFASADGKAVLVVAIDPPLSADAFDALVDRSRTEGGSNGNSPQRKLTRANGNLQVSFVDGGKAVTKTYYNREGGMARVIFTYPDGDNPFADIEPKVSNSLRVTDALKAAP